MPELQPPHNFNRFNESSQFDESFGTGFNPRVAIDPLGVEQFLGEILPAAARQENFIAGFFTGRFDDFDYDPNYDLAQDPLGHDPVFRAFPGALASVGSARQMVDVHRRLVQEIQDRAILENAGATGFLAALMAGIISPENLLPVGIAGAAIRNIAKHGGKYVARNIRRASFFTAIQTGTAEAFLQRSQFTRTPQETVFAIGASALLGGTLGAIAGGLGVAAARRAIREHDALLGGPRILNPTATILRRVEDLDPELDLDVIAQLEKVDPENHSEILRTLGIPEQAIVRDPAGRIEGVDMAIVDDIEAGRVPRGTPDSEDLPDLRTTNSEAMIQDEAAEIAARQAARDAGALSAERIRSGRVTDSEAAEIAADVPSGEAAAFEEGALAANRAALRQFHARQRAEAEEAGIAGPEAGEAESLRSLGFDPEPPRRSLRRPTTTEELQEIAHEQDLEARAAGGDLDPELSADLLRFQGLVDANRRTFRQRMFGETQGRRSEEAGREEIRASEEFGAAEDARQAQAGASLDDIDRGIPVVRVDNTDDAIADALGEGHDLEVTSSGDFARDRTVFEMHAEQARGRAEGEAQGINPMIGGLRRSTVGLSRIGRQTHRRADRDPVSRASAFERIIEARARGENVLEQFPMAAVIDAPEGRRVIADVDVTTHMELAERYAEDNQLEFDGFLDSIVETGTIDLQGRNLRELTNSELLDDFFHGEGAGRALMQDISPEDAARAVEVGPVANRADPDTIRIPEDVENIDPITRNPVRAADRPMQSSPRVALTRGAEAFFDESNHPARLGFAARLAQQDSAGVERLDRLIERQIAALHVDPAEPNFALPGVRVRTVDDTEEALQAEVDVWFELLDHIGWTEEMVDDLRRLNFREVFEALPSISEGVPPAPGPGTTPLLRAATEELVPPDLTPPDQPFRDPVRTGATTPLLRDAPATTPRLVQGGSDAGSVDADGDFSINFRTLRDLVSNERAPRDRARAAFQVTIKKAFGIEKLLTHLSPNLRIAQNSLSINARRGHQMMVESGFKYEGDDLGMTVPHSAENAIIGWNRELGEIIEGLPRLWMKYRLGREPGIGDALKLGLGDLKARAGQETSGVPGFRATNEAPELPISHNEFMERVGFAMRRSDRDMPHNGADIPEVMEAAEMVRTKLFNPTKQDAIELGLFTAEDAQIRTAESYFTRVYNIRYLKNHELEFDQIVQTWLIDIMPERIDQAEGPPIAYTREMAADDAVRIRQRILATPAGRQPYDVLDAMKVGPAKALQRRAFTIPDELIEEFLVNNVEDIVRFYVRTVVPDIELARTFGDFKASKLLARGDGEEGETPGSVWTDYQELLDASANDIDRARIIKQREADLRDLTALRDILRGTYAAPADPDSLPVRARILANRFNYLIQGGTFVLSSIPDVARVVMTDGISRVWGSALKPMITEWNQFSLATKEARLAGVAWDTILNTRALNLMELGDDYGRGTKFERGVRRGADQFANLSLLSPWNTVMKQFAGVVVQARLGEAITEIDRVLTSLNLGADAVAVIHSRSHKQLIAKLSNSGIRLEDVRRIAEQMRQAGVGTDELGQATKLWNMNTEAWTDMEMVKVMRGALRREVDKIIVTPGAGDRPLWMSTELGRLIGQYRSFSFAATQRVLIPGLQNLDRNFLNGTILAVSMGMLATKLKNEQFSRGGRDDVRYWITEGIDASGVTGILANFNQDISTLTRGQVRMGRLIGAPNLDRFTRRGFVSLLGGPTVSTLHSISRVTQDLIPSLLGGDGIRRRDVNAARRLFPTNNIFYLDSGYDWLEKGAFNTIRALQGDRF